MKDQTIYKKLFDHAKCISSFKILKINFNLFQIFYIHINILNLKLFKKKSNIGNTLEI